MYKVLFLLLSVILSTVGGVWQTPPWQTPPGQTSPCADILPCAETPQQAPPPPGRQRASGQALLQGCNSVQGNVFTPVCHSVHSRGRLADTPLANNPWADTPLCRHPPLRRNPPAGTTTPGQTPPWADTPLRDGNCSGRYASYWNAFLFCTRMYCTSPLKLALLTLTL